jgi:hypothetical protein
MQHNRIDPLHAQIIQRGDNALAHLALDVG